MTSDVLLRKANNNETLSEKSRDLGSRASNSLAAVRLGQAPLFPLISVPSTVKWGVELDDPTVLSSSHVVWFSENSPPKIPPHLPSLAILGKELSAVFPEATVGFQSRLWLLGQPHIIKSKCEDHDSKAMCWGPKHYRMKPASSGPGLYKHMITELIGF